MARRNRRSPGAGMVRRSTSTTAVSANSSPSLPASSLRRGPEAADPPPRAASLPRAPERSPIAFGWSLRCAACSSPGGPSMRRSVPRVPARARDRLALHHVRDRHRRGSGRPTGLPYDALPSPDPARMTARSSMSPAHAPCARPGGGAARALGLPIPAPERVNVLVPTIELKHLFAGYITIFNLALELAERGAPGAHPHGRRDAAAASVVAASGGVVRPVSTARLRRGRGRVRPRLATRPSR